MLRFLPDQELSKGNLLVITVSVKIIKKNKPDCIYFKRISGRCSYNESYPPV